MKYNEIVRIWCGLFPDWVTEVAQADFLYKEALRAPSDPPVFVEIGTQTGGSAVILTGAADEKGSVLYCVEPFDLYIPEYITTEQIFRKGMKETGLPNWELLKGFSEDIAPKFNKEVSLLYIDGNHEFTHVLKDWVLWSPKIVDGGIMIFHDRDCDGVSRVIDLVRKCPDFHNEVIGPSPLISFTKRRMVYE